MKAAGHTFLFKPARWEAEGVYTDAAGTISEAQGSSLVLHTENHWFLEGKMRLRGKDPLEIGTSCAIVPFPPGINHTTWSSQNPAYGRLSGRFVTVGDTIFSFFQNTAGPVNGSEWMRQIDAETYENRGVLFDGDRLLCAWAVTLKRRE